jgi:hypothetical protein
MPPKTPQEWDGDTPAIHFPAMAHRLPRGRADDRGTLVTSYAPLGMQAKCMKIRVSYRQSRPRRHQPRPVTLFTQRFGLAMRQIKTGPLRKKESLSAGGETDCRTNDSSTCGASQTKRWTARATVWMSSRSAPAKRFWNASWTTSSTCRRRV